MQPQVYSIHDPATFTFTHVVYDRAGGVAAIIDPVLDFDPVRAWVDTASAQALLDVVHSLDLQVAWILETHAHADHLSAAGWLKAQTGAKVAIGKGITRVQQRCKELFGLGDSFPTDGTPFDRLLEEGDRLPLGACVIQVMATPGHTDDSLSYLVGDAVFVGDTVFAPETGTARVDFPGGDARALYRSIQTLLALPAATRLFLCHDYPSGGRAARAETRIEEHRLHNIHVGGECDEASFISLRHARDATLPVPRLLLPALQVNIRAGQLPAPDANGTTYFRLPLNRV